MSKYGACATGLGCGSNNVRLMWAATDTSDLNAWECLDCLAYWHTPFYSVADAKRDEWQTVALAAGWTPPDTGATYGVEPDCICGHAQDRHDEDGCTVVVTEGSLCPGPCDAIRRAYGVDFDKSRLATPASRSQLRRLAIQRSTAKPEEES